MTTEPSSLLDDIARTQSIDKRNMLRLITELPEQYETAMGIGRSFPIEPVTTKPSVVFITAVDDAALAGQMIAVTVGEETDIPVVCDSSSHLPRYVDENALVFVLDYTGKSEAMLKNYREARTRGANVICVTGGGKLLEAASKDGVRIVKIPPGQPARTAIGYLFAPLVVIFEKLGLTTGLVEKLSYAVKLMKNIREGIRIEYPASRNLAKQTAVALAGKLIVVYAPPGYRQALAARWTKQIGSNSKMLAFSNELLDVVQADISGWELSDKQCNDFAVVFLKDADDKGEINDIANASKDLLSKSTVVDIEMKGATTLERLLYGLYLGDYVSYYLSILNEVNPTTTEHAAFIESRLAEVETAE